MCKKDKFGIAIHGGTGSFKLSDISPITVKLYNIFFTDLIESAYKALSSGSNSIDVIESCICKMEDSGYFNAGKGSIVQKGEMPSMDASIMSGLDLSYGTITNTTDAKNPISLAKSIKEKFQGCYSIKVADDLNKISKEFITVDKSYFETEKEWLKLMNEFALKKNSTVGCVALDKRGNLSAGTSTGGLIIKKQGRISDSSIIGAGTYANNNTCALSCSGHGETIIKTLFAHSIHSQMSILNVPLNEAVKNVFIANKDYIKYNIGMIGIDSQANIVVDYNSEIMFYGFKSTRTNTKTFFNQK